MTRPTRAYIEARIAELNKQLETMSEFGEDSDYAVDEILTWRQLFGPNSRRSNLYTFVAIKCGPNKWRLRDGYMSWNTLVDEYFSRATEDGVFRAVKFDRI